MTTLPPTEPLEAIPIPDDAIVLTTPPEICSDHSRLRRTFALAALRQELLERQLTLPLGPSIDPADPTSLLSLNRFAVQLVTAGISSDEVAIPLAFWKEAARAPQLLLAAAIDEENSVVHFPGVFTAEEFLQRIETSATHDDDEVVLELNTFRGGLDRLLTLVQLLEPAALPRHALVLQPSTQTISSVIEWLAGQMDRAFDALDARFIPAAAGAFRNGGPLAMGDPSILAVLTIPLGIDQQRLVTGTRATRCVEQFHLLLLLTGDVTPDSLWLRVVPELAGDLLPDGLELSVRRGKEEQRIGSADSQALEINCAAGDELVQVTLRYPGSDPLVLPPLLLPVP